MKAMSREKKAKIGLWTVLLPLGIFLAAAGIAAGDYGDTLRKAAMVCLECIGIG